MFKKLPLVVIAVALPLGVAVAATITFNGTQYTLQGLTVDSSGNVTVNATTSSSGGGGGGGGTSAPSVPSGLSPGSGTSPGTTLSSTAVTFKWNSVSGASSYKLNITDASTGTSLGGNINPTTNSYSTTLTAGQKYDWTVEACNSTGCSGFAPLAYFQTPAAGGGTSACGSVPNGVKVVSVPWDNYASQKYALGTSNIVAFQFTVGSARNGTISAAYSSTNPATKAVVISQCPGDMTAPLSTYCKADGYETATIAYDSGTGSWVAAYECQLKPGQTYYANVKNAQLSSLNTTTCSSNNCPFWFGLR